MVLDVGLTKGCTPREWSDRSFNGAALLALGLDPTGQDQRGHASAKVAIGLVDYGFDLLHPCLVSVCGARSRFRYLWDQNRTPAIDTRADLDLSALEDWDGALLDGEVAAAVTSGSRRALDLLYDPHANNCGRHGTIGGAHGTLMASMAAATPHAGFRGAAPMADLIGVQLALADTDWKEEDRFGQPTWRDWDPTRKPFWTGWRAYDAAPQIISAVHYIYDRGCRLGIDALVVNLSIGAWAGAHDGSSPVVRALGELIARADAAFAIGRGPRLVVVTGTGNAGADEGHWTGMVAPNAPQTFEWVMQRRDPTQNKLEIWYESGCDPLGVAITLPGQDGGKSLALTPGRTHALETADQRIGVAEHTVRERGELSCIRILLHPRWFPATCYEGAAEDTCAAAIGLAAAAMPTLVHAWLERDDGTAERSWLSPSHAESTLCCLATAPGVVVVGGYDHHNGDHGAGVCPASGSGPAPWHQARSVDAIQARIPHFVAPAHGIWGARSKSRGFSTTTGTSAAVALTSGAIAAFLAAAGAHAPLPLASTPWSRRFGHGPFRIPSHAAAGARP